MLRIPEPKEQARLLSRLLAEQGLRGLPHQKALDIVARLHGHRNWNVMRAAAVEAPAVPVPEIVLSAFWRQRLVAAAEDVVNNADDSGGEGDTTVTSSNAVEALRQALMQQEPVEESEELVVGGFNVADVLSIRPDLTEDEAHEVLGYCEKYFDANYGLNWDILEMNSFQCLGFPYAANAVLKHADGKSLPVVVHLHSGRMNHGTLESLKAARTARTHVDTDFASLPQGCKLVFGDDAVTVDMEGNSEVFGGYSDDLHQLCQELRKALIPFEKTAR